MRRFVIVFVCLGSWVGAQRGRKPRQESEPWDIRLAVPGEPGSDYPTLGDIPRTSFTCSGKTPGYYADTETGCQAFRVCTTGSTYGFQSFLCPNGTLFNQAVFVCDWWMNVNCDKTQESFSNEKFGNLRLGPQLMKDIKKMITHTMRNPYDKTAMKSNLVVMQDYKPPFNPMFGALTALDRNPNSIFVPSKEAEQTYNNAGYNGLTFAASTPNTQYVPAVNANIPSDAEVFQRQRQNSQYQQNGRILQHPQQNGLTSNAYAGQYTQSQANVDFANSINSFLRSQNQNNNQGQYNQRQQNILSSQNSQLGPSNQQSAQYNTNSQYNNGNQEQFSRQTGYTYNTNAESFNGQVNTEAKQNLVSPQIPTILSKTVTFNRIANPKPGNPKSRITFKTWIVKPSKSAKLIAGPTAYTYSRPTNPPKAKLVVNTTPYVYNVPTSAKLIATEETPYTYNRPTVAAKQVEEGPYTYNRPTAPARQVEEGYTYNRPTASSRQIVKQPPRQYLNPTSPQPTVPSRLYLNPTSALPTLPTKSYLPPTTYKPAAKLYIPPPLPSQILAQQYLGPNNIQQTAYYQQRPLSSQLKAAPTSPSPVFAIPPTEIKNNPSFSLTKHSRINTNHNNLTFADILTKEKLDITVNDIVSDTSKFLKTAEPPQFEQYRQDNSDSTTYIPPETNNADSGEALTPQSLPVVSTPAGFSRLVVDPSRDLEPPVESVVDNNQNINRLANLPFYKEPSTHNIERTVSLKISIPEKVASYLFNNSNKSDYDKLEILNTGSSNYLVLTNNLLTKNAGASFIPIGRLITNKNSNISDSQALVFSLLADSINAAKEYSNIANKNTGISTTQHFQNVNNDDLSRITNQISQLTALQYAGNQNNNNVDTILSNNNNNANQYQSAKYTNDINQNQQQIQRQQINTLPSRQVGEGFAQHFSNNNQNQIYSGQLYNLPVPEAANIYNAGAANFAQSNNPIKHNSEKVHLNAANENEIATISNLGKKSSAEVEVVQSQSPPISSAKLQLAPSNEPESFSGHDNSAQAFLGNFLNSANGISAQLQDKIVGTYPHPHVDNKLVTYKKDQTYYLFQKLDNELNQGQRQSNLGQQNAKIIQSNNVPSTVTFQLVPSVSYQLDDEKEQQKILNAFQIDEYGSPKKNDQVGNRREDVQIQNVEYSVDHPTAAKLVNGQFNDLNSLYVGPSSYSAPQASVGNLKIQGSANNGPSRLEQLDDNSNGYAKNIPARQFTF